nr:MAG TPA: hypothetical protein [Podoviridae sp. ctY3D12]
MHFVCLSRYIGSFFYRILYNWFFSWSTLFL